MFSRIWKCFERTSKLITQMGFYFLYTRTGQHFFNSLSIFFVCLNFFFTISFFPLPLSLFYPFYYYYSSLFVILFFPFLFPLFLFSLLFSFPFLSPVSLYFLFCKIQSFFNYQNLFITHIVYFLFICSRNLYHFRNVAKSKKVWVKIAFWKALFEKGNVK